MGFGFPASLHRGSPEPKDFRSTFLNQPATDSSSNSSSKSSLSQVPRPARNLPFVFKVKVLAVLWGISGAAEIDDVRQLPTEYLCG